MSEPLESALQRYVPGISFRRVLSKTTAEDMRGWGDSPSLRLHTQETAADKPHGTMEGIVLDFSFDFTGPDFLPMHVKLGNNVHAATHTADGQFEYEFKTSEIEMLRNGEQFISPESNELWVPVTPGLVDSTFSVAVFLICREKPAKNCTVPSMRDVLKKTNVVTFEGMSVTNTKVTETFDLTIDLVSGEGTVTNANDTKARLAVV